MTRSFALSCLSRANPNMLRGVTSPSRGSVFRKMVWPEKWMWRVLAAAQDALELKHNGQAVASHSLHEPCSGRIHWETVPVEVENTPEGLLRGHLGQATGDKCDYIYFEGASG